MKVTVHTDATKHARYMEQLGRMLPGQLIEIQRQEAAAVMKTVANSAKGPGVATIRQQTRERVFRRLTDGENLLTVNTRTNRGRMWIRHGNRKWQLVGHNSLKNFKIDFEPKRSADNKNGLSPWTIKKVRSLWRSGKTTYNQRVVAALKSRGLLAQSWVQVIESLGINPLIAPPANITIPANAFTATPRGGGHYQNGHANAFRHAKGFGIRTANSSPLAAAPRSRSRQKINKAIGKRRRFMAGAFRAGIGDAAQFVARFYPGIEVRRS